MNYQNPRRLVLPLAVLFALAACGGQGSGAPEAASGASEAVVQTASPNCCWKRCFECGFCGLRRRCRQQCFT